MRRARALIDLSAARHNLRRVHEAAPGSRVLAVVKANAYGHGMSALAGALGEADGFAVACLEEALALRAADVEATVLSLQGFNDERELREAAAHGIHVAVHSDAQLALLRSARLSRPVEVWLKIDTGMQRLGFGAPRARQAVQSLRALAQVSRVHAVMTQLSCADDRADASTERQVADFDRAVAGVRCSHSLANSAGILGWPATRRDWVRPGIMLYGASPFVDGDAAFEGLEPVMTLKAPILAVRELQAGALLGYGATWAAPQAMRIGVVAIGYGDGYPRHAPTGTPVLVAGQRSQLLGRVCMDMIAVDLRGCAGAPGDEVTLWGQGLPVDEVARCAGTIGYELLCAAGARVRAQVVDAERGETRPHARASLNIGRA